MKELKVAVLMGGMSTERDISLKSGKAVAEALKARGWNVTEIDVGPDLPLKLTEHKIDRAWIALHGLFGEDGCVQGLLEMMRIPYTGSGVQACAISMDKVATKKALTDTGVRLIGDRCIKKGEHHLGEEFPLVVKDPNGGSSIGVWICKNQAELDDALNLCTSETILIEDHIEGEEITVAVLEGKPMTVVSIRPKEGFFDLAAKYTKGMTEYIVPSPIAPEIAKDAQIQAEKAYRTLGMSGIARADFIVPKDGKPRFLEINASPGMTATSLSPMAAQAEGIEFPELVEILLKSAKLSLQV